MKTEIKIDHEIYSLIRVINETLSDNKKGQFLIEFFYIKYDTYTDITLMVLFSEDNYCINYRFTRISGKENTDDFIDYRASIMIEQVYYDFINWLLLGKDCDVESQGKLFRIKSLKTLIG